MEVCLQTWPYSPLQEALGWMLPDRPATAQFGPNVLDLNIFVKTFHYENDRQSSPLGCVPIQSSAYGVVSTAEKGGQAFGANLQKNWSLEMVVLVLEF